MRIEEIDRQIRAHKGSRYALDVEHLARLVQQRDQLARDLRAQLPRSVA